jgi:hypothetical protein
MKRILAATAAATMLVVGLSGCKSAADRADENLSKACENFECPRRIIGINGITDSVLFEVEGFCSYEIDDTSYEAICKNPDGSVMRTTLAKSDNVTIVVTQLAGVHVDLFKPRVIFRPETVIPNFDLSTSADQ